jgi:hypothetical protein
MYLFNYHTFHTYYTEPRNLLTDTTDCVSLYFFSGNKNKLNKSLPKCDYIIINGIKIYVSKSDISKSTCIANDGNKITEQTDVLLFSIPTMIDGNAFDFHYHFGIRTHKYIDILDKQYINMERNQKNKSIRNKKNKKQNFSITNIDYTLEDIAQLMGVQKIHKKIKTTRNKTIKKRRHITNTNDDDYSLEKYIPKIGLFPIDKNKKIIFFHKTIQKHTGNNSKNIPEGTKQHYNCYFQDNTPIESINNIVCLDEDKTVMGRAFSQFDKKIIKEIMQRPFLKSAGGRKRNTRKNKR